MKEEKRVINGKEIYFRWNNVKYTTLDELLLLQEKNRQDVSKAQEAFYSQHDLYLKKEITEEVYLSEKEKFQQLQQVKEISPDDLFAEPWDEIKHSPLKVELLSEQQLVSLAQKLSPYLNQQPNTTTK